MLTFYSLFKRVKQHLLFIFISVLIIKCDDKNNLQNNYCPFIEILSFGSDIDIKCNNTYLIFNEINNEKLNWKFANQTLFCQQKEKQQAFLNQCNITQIDSKYLKVPLKSLDHNEYACIYCPIDYKPIAPMINVTQSNDVYTFNLTATGLIHNESFEILWSKRSSDRIENSFNYWFLKGCIHPIVENLKNIDHTIIFDIDDIFINRVEFIIRRCNGICRTYRKCDDEEIFNELYLNNFQIPDSIEKISCDYDCLNGIYSTTTMNNIIKNNQLLLNKKQIIKFFILFLILGLLIIVIFIIICRIKGLRTENIYRKTNNINIDENK